MCRIHWSLDDNFCCCSLRGIWCLIHIYCAAVFVQYVNKSIQEKYIQQVFDAVLSSPEIENIQPKLG